MRKVLETLNTTKRKMKGLIVFNVQCDIVFVHYDKGFRDHVYSKWYGDRSFESDESNETLDLNVLMQMFSPLITSQRFMTEESRNPYHSVICANDVSFVIEQYHDHVLMAISGDGEESEEFMHRKLLVLQRMLRFLFGPCDEETKPETIRERDLRWHFISQLLDAWIDLYKTEQCFLIEAIERLHVNQLLNVKCIELMELTLSALKSSGTESCALHAFTIVNSKLLSLFSVRNAFELLPSDMLLIILLVRTRFPVHQKLEDFFSQSVALEDKPIQPPSIPENELYQSATEEHDLNESEENEELYSSVPSSPANSATFEFDKQECDEFTHKKNIDQRCRTSAQGPCKHKLQGNKKLLETVFPQVNDSTTGKDYQKFTAMIGTPQCKYTPHHLHCMEVMPGITVVVISEARQAKHSGPICQTISIIRAILHQAQGGTLQGKQTIEYLDHTIKKILEMAKKHKTNARIGKILADVQSKWEICKQQGLLKHLDGKEGCELTGMLSGTLSKIVEKLKALFSLLYIPKSSTSEGPISTPSSIQYCQQMIRHHLYDYKDYLAVKAQRNITMTNFVEDYPGLVHFIYIDRSLSQMTSPSINISNIASPHRIDMMAIIKEKLWSKILEIQIRLRKGHLTQILREGDFLYSYFLWFEDGTVQPLQHQRPCESVTENILPGLLAGGFYRHITRQVFPGPQQHNIRAYELFMMHVGVVPTQYALLHGKKLAAKMWETTGQANSPINLL